MSRLTFGLIFVVLSTVTGCNGRDAPSNSVVVRDSVGIRIVESKATTRFVAPWQVGVGPDWSVGRLDGDPDYLLSRVVGAMQLQDGRVLVGNGGTNEVRAYDAAGQLVQAIGREGQGPGEFEYLRGLATCHEDGFAAIDLGWRVNHFRWDGTFIGQRRVTTPEGPTPYSAVCDPAGRFLLLGWGTEFSGARQQLGYYALRDRLLLITLDGGIEADLGTWLVSERIGTSGGSGPHPAGRATVFDLHDGRVFVGSGERFEIEVRRMDGTLESLMRGPQLMLQVTDSLKVRTLDVMLRDVDAPRQPNVRRSVLEWDWPESVPAFTDLQVDSNGIVWARAHSVDPLEGEVWSLLDQENGYLGDVHLSPGQTLLEVGTDYLLVLSRDEVEVERVERYALTRSES